MSPSTETIPLPSGAAVQSGDRPDGYYGWERPEVAALVPAAAKRVVDLGCGEGKLGRLLRSRGHYVAGIELVPEAAERARNQLDEVVCCDIERDPLPWPAGSFDAVVMADVLEHLVDPWGAIARMSALLRPGGVAVSSIPNVQDYHIVRDLLRGKWEYAEAGLMDRGHLRFFTYREMVRLFDGAGLDVIDRRGLYSRRKLKLKSRLLIALSFGKLEPFYVGQYLLVGRKRGAAA